MRMRRRSASPGRASSNNSGAGSGERRPAEATPLLEKKDDETGPAPATAAATAKKTGMGKTAWIIGLTSPIWIPLVFAIIAFAIGWGVLGVFLDNPTLFALLATGTLSGLIIKQVTIESTQLFFKTSFDTITWDGAIIAIAIVLAACFYNASRQRDRKGLKAPGAQPTTLLLVGSLVALFIYLIVKGSKLPTPLSSMNQALLALSVVFPLLQVLLALRWWRHANSEDCEKYEAEVFKAALPPNTPFYQYNAPELSGKAMHTVAFGEHAIRFAKEVVAAGRSRPPSKAPAPPSAPIVLLLHGYMSGTAMWYENVKPLADEGYAVFNLDWLGGGGSDRPYWWPKNTAQAETFFIDALDLWTRAHGLENHPVILIAHSLGGYLASCYTLSYPHRVKHLVLVSPGAMPLVSTPPGLPPATKTNPTPRPIPSYLWKTVAFLWELNLTPGMLMRYMGPVGQTCARRATKGRFSRMLLDRQVDDSLLDPLGRYFYHSLAAPGSGEFCMAYVFQPGARGRNPAGPRLIEAVREGRIPSSMPITFLFGGTHDWMLNRDAHGEIVRELKAAGLQRCSLIETPKSGHHLYLESFNSFNAHVLRELRITVEAAGVDNGSNNGRGRGSRSGSGSGVAGAAAVASPTAAGGSGGGAAEAGEAGVEKTSDSSEVTASLVSSSSSSSSS